MSLRPAPALLLLALRTLSTAAALADLLPALAMYLKLALETPLLAQPIRSTLAPLVELQPVLVTLPRLAPETAHLAPLILSSLPLVLADLQVNDCNAE